MPRKLETPGNSRYRPSEIDIDTGLDELGAHADYRHSCFETLFDLMEDFHAVSRTHRGAEVKHSGASFGSALLEDR